MVVSCHQPNYLPWIGYFYKLKASDVFVVLDSVQFPNGRSWVVRNRIKAPEGQLWLTIPVKRKGRGLQKIMDIEIDDTYNWRRKHLLSLVHFYKRAPFFCDYIDFFKQVYNKNWTSVVELNLELIRRINKWLGINTKIVYSSELDVGNRHACSLLIGICKELGADTYLSGYGGRKYIEDAEFKAENIEVKYYHFDPKPYPQFWGDFISNLSIIDLLFNCGKKGFDTQVKQEHLGVLGFGI